MLKLFKSVCFNALIYFPFRLTMIDVAQWRASIGTWPNRGPNKSCRGFKLPSRQLFNNDVFTAKLLLVNSSFIIIVLSVLLLVCGDIEANPGPLTGTYV